MEPVPETERMEQFRSSPLPTLRIQGNTLLSSPELESARKPPNLRRSTDPSPTSPVSPSWNVPPSIPYRPRTTSPLSGSHVRSKSAVTLAPPMMARTQSLPGVNGAGHILYPPHVRPDSPSGSPSRVRVPRKPVDEAFPPSSPTRTSVLDPERKLSERNSSPNLAISSVPSFVRNRRPSSPLRHVSASSTPSLSGTWSTSSSVVSSPSYRPYDSLSTGYTLAASMPSSSVPSTPTSTRSRSPSISSLETIPDSPDAEAEALEAERIAQLKAAADAADGGESKGRSSLDVPSRGRTLAFGSRDKRKRWSVCGAERRGDLDLETIWED
ncbi:Basic proline-rich protein [Pleurostoma richardsiae]|uniref:Basic proline-rich protein n=1 Tax=Pleurostoma richardsiae TaxID=41990 RepID=A0AA38W0W6_9PEZI|nr:Basic proline-rich protein [Pleurostoma richardsiae]